MRPDKKNCQMTATLKNIADCYIFGYTHEIISYKNIFDFLRVNNKERFSSR